MDRRMSDVEALMWTLEKDPHLSSTFANVTLLDRPPDVDRLRRRMERALAIVPRLRQRVAPGLGRLAPPEWRDDPDVDLGWHVRRIGLPASGTAAAVGEGAPGGAAVGEGAPGGYRDLWDLATQLAAEPFDRARPLWRFTVVDGLEGGRSAMVQQLHHTITDGQGGVRMSAEFLDIERDAPEPEPVPVPEPEPGPEGLVGVAASTAGHLVRRGVGIAGRAAGDLATLARHPERLGRLGAETVGAARSLLRQVVVTDPARSPLWLDRTLRRRLEVLRVPLDDVKRTSKALGGSVNDVFVTAVAGGAGAYHRERGMPVDELRMAMPVSTREGKTVGGNAFAPTRTLVPVGADAVARFESIRDRLMSTKTEPALRLAGGLAGFANLAPTSVLVRAARQQVESVDFTTSNVRGAPFDLFIAGARIDANFPLGPVAGTAFNATVLSVAGSLDIGIHIDAGAVEAPEALRDAIEAAFDELLALG